VRKPELTAIALVQRAREAARQRADRTGEQPTVAPGSGPGPVGATRTADRPAVVRPTAAGDARPWVPRGRPTSLPPPVMPPAPSTAPPPTPTSAADEDEAIDLNDEPPTTPLGFL
jgi:hypothetical protein